MGRAVGSAWTNTETTDFDAGDYLRYDKFREQVLQNLEWFAQNHKHDGGSGAGAFLSISDPKYVWFIRQNGSPFA